MNENTKLDQQENNPKRKTKGVVVKGYLRPDGTYYVSVPKGIKEEMMLEGGEYFVVKAKPEKNKISLKLVEFLEE